MAIGQFGHLPKHGWGMVVEWQRDGILRFKAITLASQHALDIKFCELAIELVWRSIEVQWSSNGFNWAQIQDSFVFLVL